MKNMIPRNRFLKESAEVKAMPMLIFHCGGIRVGKESRAHCENGALLKISFAALGSFKAMETWLKENGWLPAAAKDSEGNQIIDPVCSDCGQKLIAWLKNRSAKIAESVENAENHDTFAMPTESPEHTKDA